jgi:hypothetical protein
MKNLTAVVTTFLLVACLSLPASAGSEKSSVGLGVSVGVSFPEGGEVNKVDVEDWAASFNWGFYVNIPLIYTFHLTPMTELYKFGDQNATDIALGFKFIIPAWVLDLYFGFVPGLTTVGKVTAPHVGGVVGCAFNLFSNLDFFIEAKYKVMFNLEDDTNITVLHANAGILYHF